MAKVIIRETIIALLVCLVVLLIISIVLYDYIPTNKAVPQVEVYSPTEEIKAELNSQVEDNSNQILMTYEVTAKDLENYERTNEYNPGKVNPFAPVSEDSLNNGNGNEQGGNGEITGTPIDGSSSSGSGGSLFESGSSK